MRLSLELLPLLVCSYFTLLTVSLRSSHFCNFACAPHFLQRLEGGLFNLQQVSIILAYACTFDASCRNKAELRLGSEQASLEEVLDTVRDMLLTLRTADLPDLDAESTGSEADKNGQKEQDSVLSAEKVADQEYKQVLTEWCAVLSTLLEGAEEGRA